MAEDASWRGRMRIGGQIHLDYQRTVQYHPSEYTNASLFQTWVFLVRAGGRFLLRRQSSYSFDRSA